MLTPQGRVALAYHYRLATLKAEQLMGLFVSLAAQAKDWREHHFLEGVRSAP
jgi:hypothetical protein